MTGPADGKSLRWWRWFAVFWLVLGAVGAALRNGYVAGLAGLFLTGHLVREVREIQRRPAPRAAPAATLLAVLAAALGAGSIYLVLRATFHLTAAWWVVVILFAALLALYAAGPFLARGPHDRAG